MRVIVLLAALCSATAAHADSTFQFEVKIGSYSAGFRIVQPSDRSRSRSADQPRDCRAADADGQGRTAATAAPAVAADTRRQTGAR